MKTRSFARQRGATLIEVLVAVLVLSIGLLGLAGLQVTSLQSNHSAYYRSQATLLAYDIADRMRANRKVTLESTAYVFDFSTSSSSHAVTGSRAAQDKAEWLNRLALTLPEGTGKIEKNNNLITIHVRWNDTRGAIKAANDNNAHTETFIYRTEI